MPKINEKITTSIFTATASLFERFLTGKQISTKIQIEAQPDDSPFPATAPTGKSLIVLLLVAALLFPLFAFGRVNHASASSLAIAPAAVIPVAPLAPPPAAFEINSSASAASPTGVIFSTVTTVGATIGSGVSSTLGFFTAPLVPAGLGAAHPVSPASALLSSGWASVGNFFGLIAPAGVKTDKPESPESGKPGNDPVQAATSKRVLTDSSAANSPSANALMLTPPAPLGSVAFDFDGDGKADISRRKASNSEYRIKNSGSGGAVTNVVVGTSAAKPAPGDFDGDGVTDAATFASGVWTIKSSYTGATQTVNFGAANDQPEVGDFDGDGKADEAVYRPSNYNWYILQSSNNQPVITSFGAAGDIPVVGNYDGDGRADIAVYRPSNGAWYILGSSSGFTSISWGVASDIPVPADYDGDGKTDAAVYRGSTGSWYIYRSNSPGNYWSFNWGNYGDQPAPADYDGDGRADLAVFRPTTGVWHIEKSCAFTGSCGTNVSPYDYQALGTAGDTAIPSVYLKQIGEQIAGDLLSAARLSPKNATGGTDLYSQNFSWGTSLIGLPGRSGMNMGFGIGYNSLVWTKAVDTANNNAQSVVFDADQSNVSPGFRFGFPVIEPAYFDNATSTFNYLMVSPSGARTRFKQIGGASDTYETEDSSYLQLKTIGAANANDPVENITITVSGTDGTRMTYLYKGGAFRCSEIKDRNGNFITVVHDEQGLLRTVTDTLGRVVTVHYDNELSPVSITEQINDINGQGAAQQHAVAVFEYQQKTLNLAFASNIGIIGPPSGATIKVLNDIAFDTGAKTFFNYNDYGQVYKVSNYAADSHLLNYTRTNLESPAAGQTQSGTDCPRFTETRNWIENFNQNGQGQAQETVITNTLAENQSYSVDNQSGAATLIQVSLANEPNGHYSKTFVGNSGWREGLPLATEDWANSAGGGAERKRWTSTIWTQDDTTKTYLQNPRVIESKVGDTTNIKRSTTEYYLQDGSLCAASSNTNAACYGLPKEIKVYDANQTTVLKTAKSFYNFGAAYLSRRIIGLPSGSELYDQNGALMSKMTYAYDEGNFSDSSLNQDLSTAIAHDNTNFGAAFIVGRASQTSVTRYDVLGQTANITSTVKYNTAGAPVAQSDPLGRTVKINYSDSFNDTTGNRNTFAYPTTLTDPAGNSSTVVYRYDFGANVRAQSPPPQGSNVGKISTREYDAIGRPVKESIVNTGAYTRYEYPANNIQSKVFSTITDTNNNGADTADEVLSESWADGAGRVRKSRTELPNSTGGYSGQMAEYDILGQTKRSTVPTEINSNWTPAGDDARVNANGNPTFLWTSQEHDWKGRTIRTINTDGTDKLISYEGCGCAGGQVTTVQGELVPRDDQPTVMARRTQKAYADILGRNYKTESLNWDGSVYSTVKTTFNGRDQETLVRQFAGTDSSATFQDTTVSYDGHGRQKQTHKPEQQNADGTPAYSIYNYNADDSIQSSMDARGAVKNFTYNDPRGLLTNINYTVPSGSNISVPAAVSVIYDNLGNRTQMTDGLGTADYSYDQLSRMTGETRSFSNFNSYTLNYTYGLSGQLSSLSDPAETARDVIYDYDKTGRLKRVGSGGFGSVSQYMDQISYRAFGTVQSATYGSGKILSTTYDNRLRPATFSISQTIQSAFQYNADGQMKFAADQLNNVYDRSLTYDALGRVKQSRTGDEARGEMQPFVGQPFREDYQYNAFNNLTSRLGSFWDTELSETGSSFANNRRLADGTEILNYDNEGNQTFSEKTREYKNQTQFDAAGRRRQILDQEWFVPPSGNSGFYRTQWGITQEYDGDGQRIKQIENSQTIYYIRSTVLSGAVISEITLNPNQPVKRNGYVYAMGELLAQQQKNAQGVDEVAWSYQNPVTGSQRGATETEPDSLGIDAGLYAPTSPDSGDPSTGSGLLYPSKYADAFNGHSRCTLDGASAPCDTVYAVLGMGGGVEVVSATGSYSVKNKATGQTKSGAFLVNSGYGVGMMAKSAFNAMGVISSGSFAISPQDAAQAAAGGWGKYFSSLFNPSSNSQFHEHSTDGGSVDLETNTVTITTTNDSYFADGNPNCISKAVQDGKLGNNNIKENVDFKTGIPDGSTGHDGIHVQVPYGETDAVTALPSMTGILKNIRGFSADKDRYNSLDILLDTKINGEAYYLLLKDIKSPVLFNNNKLGATNIKIDAGTILGYVTGRFKNDVGESGLHVTLIAAKNYKKYLSNVRHKPDALNSPISWFMDAARDPNSPFICP